MSIKRHAAAVGDTVLVRKDLTAERSGQTAFVDHADDEGCCLLFFGDPDPVGQFFTWDEIEQVIVKAP